MESRTGSVAEHKYECDQDSAEVTVIFMSMIPNIRPEDLKNIQDIARRRKSILDSLGRWKDILKTVNAYGGALAELHPAVKPVIACIKGVYDILKKQKEENDNVLDLISDMSNIIGYILDVGQFATIAQLKTVIEEAKVNARGV
ncbi:hypothetical protein OBBRIDRAFT_835942 [Obba rivulosa]|uniref:Uncharacterized protein n=1 Tax=Obba rivulosa TaxID=1052685 RepID=A0A8E2ARG1_9APHY|nr:hypothetical protein OBBRIDRAFT_835942 [Obba rivulosa]